METFSAARNTARKRYHIAEHMLTQTYPLVKDPKILLGVLQNAYGSMEASMTAWLLYEKEQKRIPTFPTTFRGKLNAFRENVKVPKEHLSEMQILREMVQEHEQSPMEITKGEKMVIFDKDYHATKLTPAVMKEKVKKVRDFLFLMETKVARNDAVIARRG